MTILFFNGTECAICHVVEPVLDRVASAKGIVIEKKESYHDDANQALLFELAEGKCAQLPFLINTETGKYLCGNMSEEQLEEFFA